MTRRLFSVLRGWTVPQGGMTPIDGVPACSEMLLSFKDGGFVLPAHAGVIPGSGNRRRRRTCAPRSRGGDPYVTNTNGAIGTCSPLTRG